MKECEKHTTWMGKSLHGVGHTISSTRWYVANMVPVWLNWQQDGIIGLYHADFWENSSGP